MAKNLKGVGGVLGNLLSSERAVSAIPDTSAMAAPAEAITEDAEPASVEQSAIPAAREKPRPPAQRKIQSRRGRPPGKKTGEAADKEKVTLRLNKELMDEYRDWSWEERCQLGELVERALSQFKNRRRQKASNA